MKFVSIKTHYAEKPYEYATDLNLEVGKTYRITAVKGGYRPHCRCKVLAENANPSFVNAPHAIIEAVEEVAPEEAI